MSLENSNPEWDRICREFSQNKKVKVTKAIKTDFNTEGPSQQPKLNVSSESQEAPDTLMVQRVPGRPL